MKKFVGVRFRSGLRLRYFEVAEEKFKTGDFVLCRTANGLEFGQIRSKKENLNDEEVLEDLKNEVLRAATKDDFKKNEDNLEFEKDVMKIGKSFVKEQNLNMNLISAVSSFDRRKLLFFFSSSGRVDFRALVKSLARVFRSKIELRQVGIRDEAKIVSGIGVCGRVFCCSSFLNDFHHVSIKMAKDQSLSLNPKKISGCCGRLMCCLQYEQDVYTFLNKVCPKIGSTVMSPDGAGVVINGNPLTGRYRVKLKDFSNSCQRLFNKNSLKILDKNSSKR